MLEIGTKAPDFSLPDKDGKSVIEDASWLSLFSGLAILITVLGYNLLGESLRDHFDPRLKR